MTFRPLPVLTGLTLVSLAILLWLGQWQYGRFEDKMARDPAPDIPVTRLDLTFEPGWAGPAQYVYGIADGEAVWRRYVPARLGETGELVLLMLDAQGAVTPKSEPLPGLRALRLEGRVFERPDRGQSARNAPADGLWYTFDTPGILAAMGLEADTVRVAEPLTMQVRLGGQTERTRMAANPYAAPTPIDPLPPQRHFGYALTWWGLAATLIGVYLAYHVSRGRLSFGKRR